MLPKKAWTGIVAGVAVLIALFWFVNRPTSQTGAELNLRVGAVLPLTGDLASYGKNAKDGIELAAQQLNDKASKEFGGTIRISLVFEDSKGQPQLAVSAFQKLTTIDRVSCVIGDIASSSTLAMAPLANSKKVVLMSPAASAPGITDAGEFVFRVWPSDAFEASVIGDYLEKKPYRKIGLAYVNNDYGQAMLRIIDARLKNFGGVILDAEGFEQNARDLRAQLTKLAGAAPEVILLVSYPKDSIIFLRQYGELGLRIPIVSTSSFEDPQILKEQGKVAEGVVFSSPLPADDADAIVRNFRKAYEAHYTKKPGLVADYAYDALRVLVEAAKLVGATDGEALRLGLRKIIDFRGASGLINFDTNGDVIKPAGLKTVRNGEYVWLK